MFYRILNYLIVTIWILPFNSSERLATTLTLLKKLIVTSPLIYYLIDISIIKSYITIDAMFDPQVQNHWH